MAKDFLLEIGTEEIPAKFAPGALLQLQELAQKSFKELRLEYSSLKAYSTPRRLALLVEGLAEKQADLAAEVKGPAVKAAYQDGKPTKAAEGFARSVGVTVQMLYTQEVNGVPYVFARKAEMGQPTHVILPKLAFELITSLHFPKPMRWGDLDFRFARPIRWIVALFGTEVVPFEFVGLTAGRISRGHRTLSQGDLLLHQAGEYLEGMKKGFIMVDPEERRAVIWDQIQALAARAGGRVEKDEELLEEVMHLVEYPTALLGKVADQYMFLPEAVITTPMREHQRYFPVRAGDGKLLPYFITVRNGNEHALEIVRQGNEKVLKARLADAAFYYQEDQKVPLGELVPKLEKITYHEKLGTVRARVERLRKLTQVIGRKLGLNKEYLDSLDRTAYLAKADLVTLMVYDFPELQGIMGADYAARSGEPTEVCQGIVEHYQPRFAGDVLPQSKVGQVVAVADKLDAIVGTFGIGIQPTGSQDPYALRRQAQGIVGIILAAEWDVSLRELIKETYDGFTEQGLVLLSLVEIQAALEDFFRQRLRYILLEEGIRYDTVDAALAGVWGGEQDSFSRLAKKTRTLAGKRDEDGFIAFSQAYVRSFNLTKKEKPQALDARVLVDPTEIALAEGINIRRERFDALLASANYDQAYRLASEIVPFIENLFLAVMIMAEEAALRQARLALLGECVEFLGCLGELSLLS